MSCRNVIKFTLHCPCVPGNLSAAFHCLENRTKFEFCFLLFFQMLMGGGVEVQQWCIAARSARALYTA